MVKNGLPVIHPGEYLAEILEELCISQTALARAIGVSPMRISYVLKESAAVRLSWRSCLAKLSINPQSTGSDLRSAYDLKTTAVTMGERLFSVHSLTHA